jgi:hypothetical protein
MENIINKIKQLNKKHKILIAVVVALVIVLFIVIAILDNKQKNETISGIQDFSSQFETRGDTVSNLLLKRFDNNDISSEGVDLRNFDIEILAQTGDWVAIHAISLELSNYGNQIYVVYQKENNEYIMKLSGSIIIEDDYANLSVPNTIINSITRHISRGSDGRLRAILDKAPNKTYPIIDSLPIGNSFYRITYHFNDQSDIDSFYLYVDAKYGYNNAAIFNLINEGFDPGDYKIVFNNDIISGKVGQ